MEIAGRKLLRRLERLTVKRAKLKAQIEFLGICNESRLIPRTFKISKNSRDSTIRSWCENLSLRILRRKKKELHICLRKLEKNIKEEKLHLTSSYQWRSLSVRMNEASKREENIWHGERVTTHILCENKSPKLDSGTTYHRMWL